MKKDKLRPWPGDKEAMMPLIYEDEDGNLFGDWKFYLAYVDWLGNPTGLEEFKQNLLKRGKTQQEIDEALAFSRSFKEKENAKDSPNGQRQDQ